MDYIKPRFAWNPPLFGGGTMRGATQGATGGRFGLFDIADGTPAERAQ